MDRLAEASMNWQKIGKGTEIESYYEKVTYQHLQVFCSQNVYMYGKFKLSIFFNMSVRRILCV